MSILNKRERNLYFKNYRLKNLEKVRKYKREYMWNRRHPSMLPNQASIFIDSYLSASTEHIRQQAARDRFRMGKPRGKSYKEYFQDQLKIEYVKSKSQAPFKIFARGRTI